MFNRYCLANRTVVTPTLLRYGVSLTAAAALLSGCGGSQPPLSVSPQGLAPQQSRAETAYHIVHPFGRSKGDGRNPPGDLIDVIDVKGTLYGTTYGQTVGNHIKRSFGNVFSLTP